jgi:uncharacterized protein YjeT (DUF2065 family)
VRIAIGGLLVIAGFYLALSPRLVAAWLDKVPATPSDVISLRASYGGTLIGIGAFVAWLPRLKPWSITVLGLLGWAMAGIGSARVVGFVVDGSADTRQWIWISAEVVLAVGCAFAIKRLRRHVS